MIAVEILLYFLLGAVISVLSGYFGVGGGFILTPILLLIGFSPLEAITTSLLFTIGTSASGIFAHISLKNILWKEGMILGIGGIVATQTARPFVLFLEKHGIDGIVIPGGYLLLLSYFALTMLRESKKSSSKTAASHGGYSVWKLIFIGFFGGFVSATLGVGGGFIIVPLLITFLAVNPKKAVGTSLFAVLMIVSAGFASYASSISIDYKIGLLLLAGGLIGSQFGARLTAFYESREMNILLGTLYAATMVSVILKLFHLNTLGLIILSLFIAGFMIRSAIKISAKNKQQAH